MNLHEYQAKEIFATYHLPVARSAIADDVPSITEAMQKVGGRKWVLKTQVFAGGRGKAGGVILVDNFADAEEFAKKHLGNRLVTYQTDALGQPVNTILVEACTDIEKELYLSFVVDRSENCLVALASAMGGMDIEKVVKEYPDSLAKVAIHPLIGPQAFHARHIAAKFGLSPEQTKQFTHTFIQLAKLFVDLDCAQIEINPLAIKSNGDLLLMDAKVTIDGNAEYRHSELSAIHDLSQYNQNEQQAQKWDLNYVELSGNIGCMVNGAGLAMGTMDIIKHYGGNPANFLDVGGGVTTERVTEALKILLSNKEVRAIFVNIFGGIVRCDLVADGIIEATQSLGLNLPIVVRLQGNNADIAKKKLESSKGFTFCADLAEAAQKVVELAQ